MEKNVIINLLVPKKMVNITSRLLILFSILKNVKNKVDTEQILRLNLLIIGDGNIITAEIEKRKVKLFNLIKNMHYFYDDED